MRTLSTYFASVVWSTVNRLVRVFKSLGLIRSTRLPVRVISVGNIQAGGAGKTPLVAKIAREAHTRGRTVCILTRGYGGCWEDSGGVILPLSDQLRSVNQVARPGSADASLSAISTPPDPRDCGDEPALLHDLCSFAYIGVGADRVRQFQKIYACHGEIDLVILDDGFQHWPIEKDLEIVALTSLSPAKVVFRDFRSSLRSAHLAVWTKGARRPLTGDTPLIKAEYQLASYAAKTSVHKPGDPVPSRASQKHCLVTGVSDGTFVYSLAQQAGYAIQQHLCFSDHMPYEKAAVRKILDQAQDAGEQVLITGKDWVKWRVLGVLSTEVTVIEPELVIKEGGSTWSQILWGE